MYSFLIEIDHNIIYEHIWYIVSGPLATNAKSWRISKTIDDTVGCRDNAVQYNMVIQTGQPWLKQNITQNLNSLKISLAWSSKATYGNLGEH